MIQECIHHFTTTFQRAFFLKIIHAHGLSTNTCEFMSSYLNDRYQRVKITNVKCSWMPLQKGIPQGSSLGTFLFNIFMNNIFYFIELCDLVNYAHANTLSIIAWTIEVVLATLKQDTENAIKWFIIHFMQVNPSKFQCMFLKPLTNKEEMLKFIEINGTNIPCEKEVKLLGITIDENVKFDKNVNIICRKAAQQINVMYRFKGVLYLNERQHFHIVQF